MNFLLRTFRDWNVTLEAIALKNPALKMANYHKKHEQEIKTQGPSQKIQMFNVLKKH